MSHVVITAINTLRNRGVEALALSIIEGLQRTLPGVEITLLTRDVDGARSSLAEAGITGVAIVPDSAWAPDVAAGALDKAKFHAKRWLRMKALRRLTPAETALARADLVIVSGGDIFSSDYRIMERYLRQYDQPLDDGRPVYFMAQSIGPLDDADERASFTAVGKRCWFSVRETISQAYLTDTLGIAPDRVILTADPAFHLAVPDAVRAAMMDAYGLTPGGYTAAAVSRGISEFKGLSHADHLQAWLEAARYLMDQSGRLVLVPHVQLPHAEEDDLSLAREIRAGLGDDPRCVVMDRLHSSIAFKAVLKGAQFVVAERTHGAIGAMSAGVPTLSVGYSIKARGVLAQLVTDPDLFAVSLIPVEDFRPGAAADQVARAWTVRDRFAAELQRHLPAVKARAEDNFAAARRLLETGHW